MDYKEISKLVKLIDSSNLSEFSIKDGEFSLRIRTDKYSKASKARETQYVSVPQSAPSSAGQQAQAPSPVSAEASTPPSQEDVADKSVPSPTDSLLEVKSPIVGTFYRSSSPDKPPYVKVGDQVNEGDVVCIVEAMKLFNEIESEVSGKVVKVLVEDAAPVEYDQPLFLVDPKG